MLKFKKKIICNNISNKWCKNSVINKEFYIWIKYRYKYKK